MKKEWEIKGVDRWDKNMFCCGGQTTLIGVLLGTLKGLNYGQIVVE